MSQCHPVHPSPICLCQQASPQGIRPGQHHTIPTRCATRSLSVRNERLLPRRLSCLPLTAGQACLFTPTPLGSAPNCRQGLRAHKAVSSLPAPRAGINL